MTNPRGMNQMIEIFFQVKFNTTYAKEDVKYDEIPEIKLGQFRVRNFQKPTLTT